jgi:ankyrin repeat protein
MQTRDYYNKLLALHAKVGLVVLLQEDLNQGADINYRDPKTGFTPFMLAADKGNLECVTALLKAGADVNAAHDLGTDALMLAAYSNHAEVIKILLQFGANVKAIDTHNQMTALMYAAQEGNVDAVKLLLASGANPNNACTDEGATSLFLAAQDGHCEVVKTLLASGANPNAACDDGETPLYAAAKNGHCEIVKALLASGANPSTAWDGETPLCAAARQKNSDVINVLLPALASQTTEQNIKAVMSDIIEAEKISKLSLLPAYISALHPRIRQLATFAPELAPLSESVRKTSSIQLTIRARNGDKEGVIKYLRQGADVDYNHDTEGCNAIYLAVYNDHLDVVKTLLEFNANPFLLVGKRSYPLYCAAYFKKKNMNQIIDLLIPALAKHTNLENIKAIIADIMKAENACNRFLMPNFIFALQSHPNFTPALKSALIDGLSNPNKKALKNELYQLILNMSDPDLQYQYCTAALDEKRDSALSAVMYIPRWFTPCTTEKSTLKKLAALRETLIEKKQSSLKLVAEEQVPDNNAPAPIAPPLSGVARAPAIYPDLGSAVQPISPPSYFSLFPAHQSAQPEAHAITQEQLGKLEKLNAPTDRFFEMPDVPAAPVNCYQAGGVAKMKLGSAETSNQ